MNNESHDLVFLNKWLNVSLTDFLIFFSGKQTWSSSSEVYCLSVGNDRRWIFQNVFVTVWYTMQKISERDPLDITSADLDVLWDAANVEFVVEDDDENASE